MFSFVTDRISDSIADAIKAGLAPLAAYLRMLAGGVLLVLLSVFAWSITVVFLALALFFAIGPSEAYAIPALWTALCSGLLAIVLLLFGLGMIRRPRP